MALDFNNALTSILGHTSLILGKMEPPHPWRSSLIEVEKSAEKAAEVAADLAAFSRQLKKQGRRGQLKMSEIYSLIYETISGHRIVKAFNMEEFERAKFLKASWRYYRINLKLAWISSLSSPIMEFIGGVVGAVIVYIRAERISRGYLSAGDFGSSATAIFYMFTPIKRLSRANNVVQQATANGVVEGGATALPARGAAHVRQEDEEDGADPQRAVRETHGSPSMMHHIGCRRAGAA